MSRSAFEIVSNISEVCKIVVQVTMFIILWAAVFGIKKAKRDGIVAGLLFFINIGIWFLSCASWVRYAVTAVMATGYSGIFHKKQIGKAVFTMLAFYNFHCLSFLIANSIYMKITNAWMKNIDGLQEGYEQQLYHSMAAGLSVTLFFYTALFAVMAVIFSRLVKGMGIMAWQEVIMLSVLNFVGSMIASMVNSLLVVKIDTGAFILFDEKPDLLWKVPMIAALIFAGETALVYFWQRYRVLLAKMQKHFVEEQQVKAMKQRLEEAENFYGSIRKVRHEMKNHMANIKGLAETGQYGEIDKYVRRMDASMQALEYKYVTGNAVTDVIINDKWRRAEKAGIRFEADFRYRGGIPVFDLGIILDNLLDNAIEACEKLERGKGFIRLDLKQKKQFLLITVENSFDGVLSMQEDNSLPHTTKQSVCPEIVTEHGIGLKNVHDMAERYYGGVKIKVEKDIFHVTVMLQQREEKKQKISNESRKDSFE